MKKITVIVTALALLLIMLSGCGKQLTAGKAAAAMEKIHDTESSKVQIRYEMTVTSDGDQFPASFLMDLELQTDRRDPDGMYSRIAGTVETDMMGDAYAYDMETYCILTEDTLKLYSGIDGEWSYEEVLPEERTALILELADLLGDTPAEAKSWTYEEASGSFSGTVKLSSIALLFETMTAELGIDPEAVSELEAAASVTVSKADGTPLAYEYDLTQVLGGIMQADAAEEGADTLVEVAYAGCSVSDILYDGELAIQIPEEALEAEAGWEDYEDWDEDYEEEDWEEDPEYEAKLQEISDAGVYTLSADGVETVFDITWPEGLTVSYFDEESAQFCVTDEINYLYYTIYEKEYYDLSEGVSYLLDYYLESFESDPESYSEVRPGTPGTLDADYPTEYVDITAKYMDQEGYHYLIAMQEYEDCWLVVEADLLAISDPMAFLTGAVKGIALHP